MMRNWTSVSARTSVAGSETLEALGRLRLDVSVIGCSGFDEDAAPMDFDPDKVAVKRLAIERARRRLLVADATKFERRALAVIAPAAAFDTLVTDGLLPRRIAYAFPEHAIAGEKNGG